jgi:hypothetical protein
MRRVIVQQAGDQWVATGPDGIEVAHGTHQRDVLEQAYIWGRERGKPGSPVTVQLRETDGTWGEERTYPRSEDPTSSPG